MRTRSAVIIFLLALCSSCNRQPEQPGNQRIAILRFENLGGDLSTDWLGRAFSEVVAGELEGATGIFALSSDRLHSFDGVLGSRPVSAPGISSERALALAAGANRIAYGEYLVRNGKLEARLTLEDVASREIVRSVSVSGPSGDIFGVASYLAQQISGRIARYATRNPEVLKSYVTVLESPDVATNEATLQQVLTADPAFAPAYRELAHLKLRRQDREGALNALGQALQNGAGMSPANRARVAVEMAVLRGDPAAREKGLLALAQADPLDNQPWRDLGLARMGRRDYTGAAESFRKAVDIDPKDPDVWNQLGYANAYAGDLKAGMDALRRYQELQPGGANPLDSMGDLNLLVGNFKEAEGYYLEAAKKDPSFFAGVDFLKAAISHLMTGDVPGADAVAQQYFAARESVHDPLTPLRRAQWSWISGRQKEAYKAMEDVAHQTENGPLREVASHAYTQLAMWNLMSGNREAAEAASQKSLALMSQTSAAAAVVTRFLAQPPVSPAEWNDRAQRFISNPAQAPIRNLALAYALLVGKHYQAAAPVLQQLYNLGSNEEGIPVMLAWADLEVGRVQEAATLLRTYPIPPTAGLGPFTTFYFPRYFALRARAAEKLGKADEARKAMDVLQKLSGGDPVR